MKTLNRQQFDQPQYTTRILQFGEGNFLRGFLDWQIDLLNSKTHLDAGIAVVRPIATDFPPLLNGQDGLYTSVIRGINEAGQPVEEMRIISSINQEIPLYQDYDAYFQLAEDPNIRFIFSNTTEAGIAFNADDRYVDAPPSSFPAKLTQWLYRRYLKFQGDENRGLYIIPCELIDYNGDRLKEIVEQYIELWSLEEAFKLWLERANVFCSTLVDRIVTGHPRQELDALEQRLGYRDQFMVTAEYFYLFVIQGPQSLAKELNLTGQSLNIKLVDDIKPYKERKVAILNGAHTAMVPVAYMAGLDTVGESMDNTWVSQFVNRLLTQEVIPALSLPQDELTQFADDVIKRFKNPYIQHQLTSIALNSMTKWVTRLLPQLLTNVERNGSAPRLISLAFAAQILFYRGMRDQAAIPLDDDSMWLELFAQQWQAVERGEQSTTVLVHQVCAQSDHWGCDLNNLAGFSEQVSADLSQMLEHGVLHTLRKVLGD